MNHSTSLHLKLSNLHSWRLWQAAHCRGFIHQPVVLINSIIQIVTKSCWLVVFYLSPLLLHRLRACLIQSSIKAQCKNAHKWFRTNHYKWTALHKYVMLWWSCDECIGFDSIVIYEYYHFRWGTCFLCSIHSLYLHKLLNIHMFVRHLKQSNYFQIKDD